VSTLQEAHLVYLRLKARFDHFEQQLTPIDLKSSVDVDYESAKEYDALCTIHSKQGSEIKYSSLIQSLISDTSVYLINASQHEELLGLISDYKLLLGKDSEANSGRKRLLYPLAGFCKVIDSEKRVNKFNITIVPNATFVSHEEKVEYYMDKEYQYWVDTVQHRIQKHIELYREKVLPQGLSEELMQEEITKITQEHQEELKEAKADYEMLKEDQQQLSPEYEIVYMGYHNPKPYLKIDVHYSDKSSAQNIHLYKDGVPNYIYYEPELSVRSKSYREQFMEDGDRICNKIWFRRRRDNMKFF
jgi:hypothetical protein